MKYLIGSFQISIGKQQETLCVNNIEMSQLLKFCAFILYQIKTQKAYITYHEIFYNIFTWSHVMYISHHITSIYWLCRRIMFVSFPRYIQHPDFYSSKYKFSICQEIVFYVFMYWKLSNYLKRICRHFSSKLLLSSVLQCMLKISWKSQYVSECFSDYRKKI